MKRARESNTTFSPIRTGTQIHKTNHAANDVEKPRPRNINKRCQSIEGVYNMATADVNFVFNVRGEEQVVPSHKCILAFHSSEFRRMFYVDDLKGDVKLTDTTIDAFVDFMESLYAEIYIKGSRSNISPLLYLAHKYDVNWLEDRCKQILNEIINTDVQAIFWVLPLFDQYSYTELVENCNQLIRERSNLLIQSSKFIDCGIDMVKRILDVDFVDRNEAKVFEMCVKRAKRACEKLRLDPESPENIRAQFGDYFDLIRFQKMDSKQFMQCLIINQKFFEHDEIQRFASKFISSFTGIPTCKDVQQPNEDVVAKKYRIISPFTTSNSSLPALLDKKDTADVVFVFKNEQYLMNGIIGIKCNSAHKCILARECEFFANQFQYNLSKFVMTIGVSADHFNTFLRLVYTYTYKQQLTVMKDIPNENVATILSLAFKYEASAVIRFYGDYLSEILDVTNVLRHFEWAQTFSMNRLRIKCIDLLNKKGDEVLATKEFINISHQTLKELLKLNFCKKADAVVDACIRWAEEYCQKNQLEGNSRNLRTALGDAFGLVPFSSMDSMALMELLRDWGDMFTGEEIKNILQKLTK